VEVKAMTKTSAPTSEDLISYDEAAALLNATRRTVQRMVDDGRLKKYTKPVTSGRRGRKPVFVDRRDVEQLLRTVLEVKT
jgi:excisionase family DNA binding protein